MMKKTENFFAFSFSTLFNAHQRLMMFLFKFTVMEKECSLKVIASSVVFSFFGSDLRENRWGTMWISHHVIIDDHDEKSFLRRDELSDRSHFGWSFDNIVRSLSFSLSILVDQIDFSNRSLINWINLIDRPEGKDLDGQDDRKRRIDEELTFLIRAWWWRDVSSLMSRDQLSLWTDWFVKEMRKDEKSSEKAKETVREQRIWSEEVLSFLFLNEFSLLIFEIRSQ